MPRSDLIKEDISHLTWCQIKNDNHGVLYGWIIPLVRVMMVENIYVFIYIGKRI